MPDIHRGKQTKLSKTMGPPLYPMREIVSSHCPNQVLYHYSVLHLVIGKEVLNLLVWPRLQDWKLQGLTDY